MIAEGATYTAPFLLCVHNCDERAAEIIYTNMKFGGWRTTPMPNPQLLLCQGVLPSLGLPPSFERF
jgi:hypothetical protein